MKISRLTICFILALSLQAMAAGNYAVFMQESPAGAGEINPGTGIHNFGVNETVALTTVARPGWKFIYWLGDVSDHTSNRTLMSVDGPKIVIAVFQRDAFAMPSDNLAGGSAGPERLIGRFDPAVASGTGGGDTPSPRPPHYEPYYPYYPPTPPTPPEPPEPPTPPPGPPPVPPEVPEPATMALLAAGVLGLITRKKDYLKNMV
jgi:hypothetical protein